MKCSVKDRQSSIVAEGAERKSNRGNEGEMEEPRREEPSKERSLVASDCPNKVTGLDKEIHQKVSSRRRVKVVVVERSLVDGADFALACMLWESVTLMSMIAEGLVVVRELQKIGELRLEG